MLTHWTTPSWHFPTFLTLGQVLLAGCAAGAYLLSGPGGLLPGETFEEGS